MPVMSRAGACSTAESCTGALTSTPLSVMNTKGRQCSVFYGSLMPVIFRAEFSSLENGPFVPYDSFAIRQGCLLIWRQALQLMQAVINWGQDTNAVAIHVWLSAAAGSAAEGKSHR